MKPLPAFLHYTEKSPVFAATTRPHACLAGPATPKGRTITPIGPKGRIAPFETEHLSALYFDILLDNPHGLANAITLQHDDEPEVPLHLGCLCLRDGIGWILPQHGGWLPAFNFSNTPMRARFPTVDLTTTLIFHTKKPTSAHETLALHTRLQEDLACYKPCLDPVFQTAEFLIIP